MGWDLYYELCLWMNFDINIILNNKKLHIISNITRFHHFLSNTVFLEYNIFPVVILKDMKEEPLSTWQSYHSLSQRSLRTGKLYTWSENNYWIINLLTSSHKLQGWNPLLNIGAFPSMEKLNSLRLLLIIPRLCFGRYTVRWPGQ